MLVELIMAGSFIYGISKYKKAKKLDLQKQSSSGNIRREQFKILSADDESQKSKTKKKINQNLLISFGSLGMSIFVPSLSLASVFGILYLTFPIFRRSYQKLKKGK